MYSSIKTAVLSGIDSIDVICEADVSDGLPVFDMVGFLSTEVKESRERVRTALRNTGFTLPPKRITINIFPASIRKSGTGFDLPIACAILGAMGVLPEENLKNILMVGELSLEGEVLPVKGVLPIALNIKDPANTILIVPEGNRIETSLVPNLSFLTVHSLSDVISLLMMTDKEREKHFVRSIPENKNTESGQYIDFKDIHGQRIVKRAAEIAAAGKHHLLMIGPPGAGKTMSAKGIPSILPPMSQEEKLTLSKIYSVSGFLANATHLVEERPFRAPHHTTSVAGLAGGGNPTRPGEISLSTSGVLFLDELPEFRREALEILRQPLEEKTVTIARASGVITYPADFLMILAMNPCPCGYFPNKKKCRCTYSSVSKYLNKISQPLLDRIDLSVEAEEVSFHEINSSMPEESSEVIRNRVIKARDIQTKRFQSESYSYNSEIPSHQLSDYCPLGKEESKFMESAYEKEDLSVRSYQKILRVARTIADLDGEESIGIPHLMEAISFRKPDQKYWNNEFYVERGSSWQKKITAFG